MTDLQIEGRTSARMAGALYLVEQGMAPREAAHAGKVTIAALYKAMSRHNIGGERCPACGRKVRAPSGASPA